jgi:hypothetical protein
MREGTLDGIELWRQFHAGGQLPPEPRDVTERGPGEQ